MKIAFAQQNETIDDVIYRVAGNSVSLEQVLKINPNLLALERLPIGTQVKIPDAQITTTKQVQAINLWD